MTELEVQDLVHDLLSTSILRCRIVPSGNSPTATAEAEFEFAGERELDWVAFRSRIAERVRALAVHPESEAGR